MKRSLKRGVFLASLIVDLPRHGLMFGEGGFSNLDAWGDLADRDYFRVAGFFPDDIPPQATQT